MDAAASVDFGKRCFNAELHAKTDFLCGTGKRGRLSENDTIFKDTDFPGHGSCQRRATGVEQTQSEKIFCETFLAVLVLDEVEVVLVVFARVFDLVHELLDEVDTETANQPLRKVGVEIGFGSILRKVEWLSVIDEVDCDMILAGVDLDIEFVFDFVKHVHNLMMFVASSSSTSWMLNWNFVSHSSDSERGFDHFLDLPQ